MSEAYRPRGQSRSLLYKLTIAGATTFWRRKVGLGKHIVPMHKCAYTEMEFTWDQSKCRANVAKHSVDFADAVAVFEDPLAISMVDLGLANERRFVALGQDGFGRLLVVCYVEKDECIRIISARPATRSERHAYEG